FAADVRRGLSAQPKWLPCKYFYDERGSQLFEEICTLPEYYLTRTELAILEGCAPEIATVSRGNVTLVELGSGSSRKTRLLLEALIAHQGDLHYVPIDISESMLVDIATRLVATYPTLTVTAYVAEYNDGIRRIAEDDLGQKLVIFLGSNIGNFDPPQASAFLGTIRRALLRDDYLLIGMDMEKDVAVLEAAYDDSQGVTAEFNLNLLRRINRELGGEFDLNAFSHVAFYNAQESRIEMHLRSEADQAVCIRDFETVFPFGRGETIHTENSYKYTDASLRALAAQTGFDVVRSWQDAEGYFSLTLLTPA
ncbi:MAG: L-histidine N(alpha)-methyltransferase, partial [Nitrospinota bacterium]